MAENNEEFSKIEQMSSAEQMLEHIGDSADPFAGYDIKDLQSLADKINGFDNTKAKEAVLSKLNEAINKQLATQSTPAQEVTPSENTTQSDEELFALDFMSQPSYSQYAAFKTLHSKAVEENNTLSDEDISNMNSLLDNAQKAVDLASNADISPDNAVLLKDYISIIREGKTLDEAEEEKLGSIEAKVDEQLKEFDKENNLTELEGVSANELTARENDWYNVAKKLVNEDEASNIIKNLAIQELKVTDEADLYLQVIEHVAAQNNKSPFELKEIYNRGLTGEGEPLSEDEKTLLELMEKQRESIKSKVFTDKFSELAEQFEITKAMERAKLTAEELYPITDEMDESKKLKAEKDREEYIAKWLEDGKISEADWIEENTLRALRNKYKQETLSDEDFKKAHSDEYALLEKDYKDKAKSIEDFTKAAYVTKIELLANRSARITKSDDINGNTKEFLNNFAQEHPDLYRYGKTALVAGKKALLRQAISHTAGLGGLAVYSAYNTYNSFKKSYNDYLQKGGEKGFRNFIVYLRKPENRDKRINLAKQAALSGITLATAVATYASGLGLAGAAAAPIVKRVADGVVNIGAETSKLIGSIKDRYNAQKSGDEEAKKTAGKRIKQGLVALGVAAATVALGTWASKFFSKDDNNNENDVQNDLNEDPCNTAPENLFKGTEMNTNQPIEGELEGVGLGQNAIHIGAKAPKLDGDNTNADTDTDASKGSEENSNGNSAQLRKVRRMVEKRNNNGNDEEPSKIKVDNGLDKPIKNEEGGEVNEVTAPQKVKVQVDTDKKFLGITTKKDVATNEQEVVKQGNDVLNQREAAIAEHAATGAKHMRTEIVNENGEVVSSARYTVRGDVENNQYKVKGKIETSDGVIREKVKVDGDTKYIKYKGLKTKGDLDGDGEAEKIVGKVEQNGKEYYAVKTSTGKKVIMEKEASSKDFQKAYEVNGSLKKVLKNIAKEGRS